MFITAGVEFNLKSWIFFHSSKAEDPVLHFFWWRKWYIILALHASLARLSHDDLFFVKLILLCSYEILDYLNSTGQRVSAGHSRKSRKKRSRKNVTLAKAGIDKKGDDVVDRVDSLLEVFIYQLRD